MRLTFYYKFKSSHLDPESAYTYFGVKLHLALCALQEEETKDTENKDADNSSLSWVPFHQDLFGILYDLRQNEVMLLRAVQAVYNEHEGLSIFLVGQEQEREEKEREEQEREVFCKRINSPQDLLLQWKRSYSSFRKQAKMKVKPIVDKLQEHTSKLDIIAFLAEPMVSPERLPSDLTPVRSRLVQPDVALRMAYNQRQDTQTQDKN